MRIKATALNLIKLGRTDGFLSLWRTIVYRLYVRYQEFHFGIDSEAVIYLKELGVDHPECNEYSATSYQDFRSLMRHVNVDSGKEVFLDYGAGMGRTLILAATYPFKRAIGVELSDVLCHVAHKNLERSARSSDAERLKSCVLTPLSTKYP